MMGVAFNLALTISGGVQIMGLPPIFNDTLGVGTFGGLSIPVNVYFREMFFS